MLNNSRHISDQFVLGTASLVGRFGGYGLSCASDEESRQIISCALDHGVQWFDTAPIYGFGAAETLLGAYSNDQRMKIISKAGVQWTPEKRVYLNNSSGLLWDNLHATLKRIRRDCVDLYILHWPDSHHPTERALETLLEMKAKGLVGEIGLSNFTVEDTRRYAQDFPISTLQNDFNDLLSTDHLNFTNSLQNQIKVQAYGVLGKGLYLLENLESLNRDQYRQSRLSEHGKAGQNDFRVSKHFDFKSLQRKGKSIQEFLKITDTTFIQPNEILRAALQHPAIDQLVIGQSSKEQLLKNLKVCD